MEGRFLNLFKVFRRKKKKGAGVSPPQQPEEPEEPMQDGAAMDRTQEQDTARGCFRRALKMLRKFVLIRRRNTSTATEGTAEPDSRLTEIQAEPDVSADLSECSEDSDTARNDDRGKADMAGTEDTAMTIADIGENQGITNTDTTPTLRQELIVDYFKDPCASSQQHLSNLGPVLEASQDCVSTHAMFTGPPQSLRPAQCGRERSTSWRKLGSCSLGQRSKSSPCLPQVPAMVKSIHRSLISHAIVDVRLQIDIVRLAEEHPADMVLTLLRCAPTCDRAAVMMWRTIGPSKSTVEKVLPTLLCVMEDWPLHRMCTSDGDNKDVFALAATLALRAIIQVPKCHEAMDIYAPHLLVALLVQIFNSTMHGTEEVDSFWTQCQAEHNLQTNHSRFAVQTMKSLLFRLRCDNVVMAMVRKHGWDTLLCADTHHYAVGLLAREMRHIVNPLCSRIACYLLQLLNTEEPRWDLPFLAFLVEVFECFNVIQYGDNILKIMSRYLQSECRERCHLALRGLVLLSKDPSMARRICSLSQSLLDLLGDADGEVVGMTLCVFTNVLQDKDVLISSTTSLKLAEALLMLLDNDNSHVQELSLDLFVKTMQLVVDEGKKPLMKILSQSLLPLFLHCHDESEQVAKASRQTLHCAVGFLKKTNLQQVLNTAELWNFAECLLAEDRSRAAEHLRQALPYLESPQEPLREAAVRFMGMAGQYLMGQKEELQLICEGLDAPRDNTSLSWCNTGIQPQFANRAEEVGSLFGSRKPMSQEHYQETLKRTPHPNVAGALGTADAGHS
ncbi:maestro heat-like repeat-containing protein family member 6 [Oenanthe melanoleuca]|uniref:maestro heat-like repeat-containing protein family member 6 n=1 Tax=Oenanthe melanoleuca TaxID=2939378 RepID=UPI0024C16F11|nr:maestro heat-like repeat-containing protein family member 6 [Oenanthe melanoleuca]